MQRGCSVRHIFQANISFSQIAPGHRIKQRQNFLCNSQNKTRLIEFLVSDWSLERQRTKLKGKDVYVTVGEICKHLTEEMVCEVDDLKCTHEENAPPCGPLWHYWLQSSCNCIRRHWRFHCVSVLHPTCLVQIGSDAWGWAMLCSARPTCFHRLWYCMCFCSQRKTQGPSFDEQECSTQGNTRSSR